MKIEIDETKILKEILEIDKSIHFKIKMKVEERLVNDMVHKIEKEFFEKKFDHNKEISDNVIERIKVEKEKVIKGILEKLLEELRWGRTEKGMIKRLKEFVEKEVKR